MSTKDLFDNEAQLDDEEEDEDFDEETGEARKGLSRANGDLNDSSEEEDDEDDEDAAREVAKGFIDDEEEELEDRAERRRQRKKRKREQREKEEEEGLDEEDLDLIGEANPEFERHLPSEPKFKRLKRGHKLDRKQTHSQSHDIFDDDDEEDVVDYGARQSRMNHHGVQDEFEDFIEEDVFSDDEGDKLRDEVEVARPLRRDVGGLGVTEATGLDETALEDMQMAFGDGHDYSFALAKEEEEDFEEEQPEKQLELKDVFEPSQLAEKMMTEEDNEIRLTDEPERFQIDRKPYKHVILTDEQFREEALWISNLILPKKRFDIDMREPFQKAVAKVLDFMIVDEYEVPFIFQHRKDYLIHAAKVAVSPDPYNPGAPEYEVNAMKLLNQTDLWDIYDYDLKFRGLIDKRNALQRTYDNLATLSNVKDDVFLEMLPAAVTMEELQDVQEYLHFQYASQLKDIALMNGTETIGTTQRRPGSQKGFFERVRSSNVYSLVRAFGITADAFAQNTLRQGKRQYTEDPTVDPEAMADGEDILDSNFSNSAHAWKAAVAMFAEEIATSPRMRKVIRGKYYEAGVFDCLRTDKGLRRIDEQHPYYEFKYLRNLSIEDIARQPDLYLRMLKAEEEGMIEVRVRLQNYEHLKKRFHTDMVSDNQSTVADAWNKARKEVIDMAIQKIERIISRGVKENLRTVCEDYVAKSCRDEFSKKLDQAPFKPKGMELGTTPRVLTFSNGSGVVGRDQISWIYLEDDGRVLENGKLTDLALGDREKGIHDGADVPTLVELVERRRPDVIGVSGFSTETRKLYKQICDIVEHKDLRGGEYDDPDDEDNTLTDRLDVVIVNDEVARLYQTSERAKMEHPGFAPLTNYCVAIGKYLQSPMKEYAALGSDITSISFHPCQTLVPADKIKRQLETALVDMVNLVGVDINEAVGDLATANLLNYICGLGPRKAQHLLKAININGGEVESRLELLGDPEQEILQAVGPKVWANCASFVFIVYDKHENNTDYLDNTRVHPEDYDIGKKMAADALELDEEDIKAETDENGAGAIVRKLINDDAQDKVNDLILEEYAEQLEQKLNQRKRATLETIRAELQSAYEELRRPFTILATDEIFTMFTGETRDSLPDGAIVAMSIKRIQDDHIDGKLDCGVEAVVPEAELTDRFDVSVKSLYSLHQTVQVKILYLNRKTLLANVSLREEQLARPYRKQVDRMRDEWDDRQETADKELLREKADVTGRTQRVIKHPNFRAFSKEQAEEYLGSQNRGDVVIRPSSRGLDHLAVTWKVSDGIFQHIDVLELDKENEFSLGRTLKIGGKYTYSDLDELIVNHVKAMAKKVDEMTLHDKFQSGTKADTERWLTTYTEANPKRSVYAFCINPKFPGFFYLCFKAGLNAQLQNWAVKVIPQGFELQKIPYPDMRALCNGFKLVFMNMQAGKRR